ncbi:unnamed protein product [Staurois parvus]|uniref:Uncharacterized protein n=1 Tax=Staurois parvus TaxID=386267 RepID=A0ABN9D7G6_9NEOB|nr:unnamed protein product [Staurois parvus]
MGAALHKVSGNHHYFKFPAFHTDLLKHSQGCLALTRGGLTTHGAPGQ